MTYNLAILCDREIKRSDQIAVFNRQNKINGVEFTADEIGYLIRKVWSSYMEMLINERIADISAKEIVDDLSKESARALSERDVLKRVNAREKIITSIGQKLMGRGLDYFIGILDIKNRVGGWRKVSIWNKQGKVIEERYKKDNYPDVEGSIETKDGRVFSSKEISELLRVLLASDRIWMWFVDQLRDEIYGKQPVELRKEIYSKQIHGENVNIQPIDPVLREIGLKVVKTLDSCPTPYALQVIRSGEPFWYASSGEDELDKKIRTYHLWWRSKTGDN